MSQMRQRAPAGGGLGRVHAAPLKLVVLVLYAAGLMVGGAAPMSSAPDRRSLEPTRLASALPNSVQLREAPLPPGPRGPDDAPSTRTPPPNTRPASLHQQPQLHVVLRVGAIGPVGAGLAPAAGPGGKAAGYGNQPSRGSRATADRGLEQFDVDDSVEGPWTDGGTTQPRSFAATIAFANALSHDVHVTVQIGGGVYSGPDACNATLTHPFVAVVGNGSETTVFDCGWASRWLAYTGTSLALSGITIINASSFSNGVEAGGVVSGGAVLVDWGGGGTNLSFTMRDVVVQGARRVQRQRGACGGPRRRCCCGHYHWP